MNRRTTLVLLLLSLALGFYILRFDVFRPGTDERRALQRKALLLNPAAIDRLVIAPNGQETFGCELRQGAWMMTAPAGARADYAKVSRLMQKLDRMKKSTEISRAERTERGLDWADYGLETPLYRLQLFTKQEQVELWLGTTSTNRFPVYARLVGRDDVLRVDDDTLGAIPASSSDLRDRQVFLRSAAETVRLELSRPSGQLRLQRLDSGAWMLDQPLRARAAPEMVSKLLDLLHTLRIEQFVADTDSGLSKYGFTDESPTLRVFHKDADFPVKITIGGAMTDNPRLAYARLDGMSAVFAVSEGMRRLAEFEVDALRDRRLLGWSASEVHGLKVSRPGGAVVSLKREEAGRWTVAEPKAWPADEERVLATLAPWVGATAALFTEIPRGADTNAVAGQLVLEAEFTGPPAPAGAERRTFQVYSGGTQEGRGWVRNVDDGSWARVVPPDLVTTSSDVLHYRERTVLQVSPEELREIFRKENGRESVVNRADPSQPWQSPEGGGVADAEALATLVRMLNPLRAERLVEFEPRDPSVYGLESPALTLTLGLAGETGISRTLLFGAPDANGLTPAMIRGQDLVFLLAPEARAALTLPILKPRGPDAGTPGPTTP